MELSREQIEQIASSTAQNVLENLHRYTVEYKEPASIEQGLRDSMIEEKTAADWYRKRAENAPGHANTFGVYQLYRHIAEEEEQHYAEFKNQLEKIESQSNTKEAGGRLLESTGKNWKVDLKTGTYILWKGESPRTGHWLYHVTRPEFYGTPVFGFTNKEVAFRDAMQKKVISEFTPIPT